METILGKDAVRFLREIMSERRQLTLFVSGTDYARLTIIIDLALIDGRMYVVMDSIRGFPEVMRSRSDGELVFECSDSQKIPYSFKTKLYKAEDSGIWIYFPKEIVRIQRRRHFRINAPTGSKMIIFVEERRGIPFDVVNISISGLAITVPLDSSKAKLLENGDNLEEIKLELPLEEQVYEIYIDSAVVRRTQDDVMTNLRLSGLEFTDIDSKSQSLLQEYIRNLERSMLRKKRLARALQ